MHQGPEKSDQSQRQHTPFSKFFGAVVGATGEQLIFHPVDTTAKALMAQKQGLLPWMKVLLAERGVMGGVMQLYNGLGLALIKKPPMRWYKYGVQDEINAQMTTHYQEAAKQHFGLYSKVVMQCFAGGVTGIIEPWFFQPIDTLQIRKQVLKEQVTKANAQALGLKGLYRGALFTGFGRNLPGSIGLFGGSAFANQVMKNDDYASKDRSQLLNLAAKWFGALTSLVLSQPGDVIKTNMQVKQVPLREAFKDVTVKQLFTGGLGPRLFMSFKVGVGFFLIEEAMNYSRILFGKDSDAPTPAMTSADDVSDFTETKGAPLLTQYHSQRIQAEDDEPTFGAYDDPLMNDLANQLKKCRF